MSIEVAHLHVTLFNRFWQYSERGFPVLLNVGSLVRTYETKTKSHGRYKTQWASIRI